MVRDGGLLLVVVADSGIEMSSDRGSNFGNPRAGSGYIQRYYPMAQD